jgi:hypothetical protein
VAWIKVCRPPELGGLGISELKTLGWSLRMRWAWLQKTEPHRPWAALPIQLPDQVRDFFSVAVAYEIGDGANTLFWSDRWLHGQCIADLAPRLFAAVSKRRVKRRSVRDALSSQAWISDIQGARTVGVLVEFLQLCDVLMDFQLQPEVEDRHIWRLSSNGIYSAKSAYDGFFLGSTLFRPWERIWKSWAPPKCRFFLWLVAHNACWTADRLARRGLPHPECCPLCDQEEETIDHLLVNCVFAREFWFFLFRQVGLQNLSPQSPDLSFHAWWDDASSISEVGLKRQGVNSLIILGAWTIWNHRNSCVFDGAAPNLAKALILAGEERHLWSMAGARGLSFLAALLPGS